MRDKNEGKYTWGRREDTCDHGLSKTSLRVKPVLRVELEAKSSITYKKTKKTAEKSLGSKV